jgi:serine/threonine protein kinase
VRVFDNFKFNSHRCIVMEIYGESMTSMMKRINHVGLSFLCMKAVLYQIVRSLCFLHSLKIVHSDIKPDNILVEKFILLLLLLLL